MAGDLAVERETCILVPVYNEAPSVEKVLRQVAQVTRAAVVVIDDGSTDGSSAILERLASRGEIGYVRHQENLGYGQALIDGFGYARQHGFRYCITLDGDEQHEPRLIPRFLAAVQEADIVSGSRYLEPPSGKPVPADRREINRLMTEAINRITGLGITDAFCGFKAYRLAALEELDLTEAGYAFPLQVWIQAWRRGLRVKELPVPLIYKPNFERRFGGGLDDPAQRLAYYREVLAREVARWSTCS